MFRSAWDQRLRQAEAMKTALRRDTAKLDREIGQLLDRVVEATNGTVIATYERRIAKLEKDKLVMAEKLAKSGHPQRPFDEMFELALSFLANPQKLWASGEIALQKTVLRLAFADRLAYAREGGFRTPKMALPFKLLEQISMGKCEMAERAGLKNRSRSKPYFLGNPLLCNPFRP